MNSPPNSSRSMRGPVIAWPWPPLKNARFSSPPRSSTRPKTYPNDRRNSTRAAAGVHADLRFSRQRQSDLVEELQFPRRGPDPQFAGGQRVARRTRPGTQGFYLEQRPAARQRGRGGQTESALQNGGKTRPRGKFQRLVARRRELAGRGGKVHAARAGRAEKGDRGRGPGGTGEQRRPQQPPTGQRGRKTGPLFRQAHQH